MKKIILSFVVVTLLFSCSKKEQYYGTWSQYFYTPAFLNIKQDSISLSNDGNLWNTYPVTIKNNSLTFLDHTFKTSFSGDSLVFENLTFKKDTVAPFLEIELSEFKNFNFYNPDPDTEIIYIRFGKVPNSNEYKLQLNNKYAEFEELIHFFFSHYNSEISHHALRRFALLCDKRAKMKDVEHIFLELIKINALVLYTVNDIEHEVVDSKVQEKYSLYKHRITPIHNIRYEIKTDSTDITGFDFLSNITFRHVSNENTQFLFLINNEFYVGKEKYSLEDFSKRIDIITAKNVQLVSLFDLNSDFEHYTIFNAVLNDSYEKLYESIAKQKHNTPYNQLTDDQKEIIRTLHPQKNIQNISIPHFLSFEELPMENVEFPFKNVKEQIPEVYFK
ncbi:hypothetical protein [uncultured Kordia sp.]|uniref:hypothetical protein n=1 Tax=uncultured Kordia sp. TaxID=507699 RepID=UPI00260F6ECE|nr:hypothetical protein [uncultured Kordia sp.]